MVETMISDDERRDVAERMRVYSHDFDFGDSYPFWYVVKAAFGDVDAHTYYSVFARLADLIYPTCHIVTEQHDGGAGEFVGQSIDYVCSSCGSDMPRDRFTGAFPRYCPNCGARVVTDDDYR